MPNDEKNKLKEADQPGNQSLKSNAKGEVLLTSRDEVIKDETAKGVEEKLVAESAEDLGAVVWVEDSEAAETSVLGIPLGESSSSSSTSPRSASHVAALGDLGLTVESVTTTAGSSLVETSSTTGSLVETDRASATTVSSGALATSSSGSSATRRGQRREWRTSPPRLVWTIAW